MQDTDTSNPPPGSGTPAVVRRLTELQDLQLDSGMTQRERIVIRDTATWTTVWHEIVGKVQPQPALPKVDFDNELLIVAAMGTKNTGGYSIVVDGVRIAADGDAAVSVTETSPGARCPVTDVVTAPIDVVVTDRFDGKATFAEHTAVQSCGGE